MCLVHTHGMAVHYTVSETTSSITVKFGVTISDDMHIATIIIGTTIYWVMYSHRLYLRKFYPFTMQHSWLLSQISLLYPCTNTNDHIAIQPNISEVKITVAILQYYESLECTNSCAPIDSTGLFYVGNEFHNIILHLVYLYFIPLGTIKHILNYLNLSNEYALSLCMDVTSAYNCLCQC